MAQRQIQTLIQNDIVRYRAVSLASNVTSDFTVLKLE